MRYQVFNSRESTKPVFSAPWQWLAYSLANLLSMKWSCCRLIDSQTGELLMEWIRADRLFVLGGNSTFAFVKTSPDGSTHTHLYGSTHYGLGQEPKGGHRPITVIDNEASVISSGTRLDFVPQYHRQIQQGPYAGYWTTSDEDGPSPVFLLGQRVVNSQRLIVEAILIDERRRIEAAGGRII